MLLNVHIQYDIKIFNFCHVLRHLMVKYSILVGVHDSNGPDIYRIISMDIAINITGGILAIIYYCCGESISPECSAIFVM